MIRLENVSKIFGTGVAGLSHINLLVDRGEFVFLVGHTGSGKTTMLRLIVRDMLPTEGTIVVSDLDVVKLPSNKIPHLRKKVGVIFQDLKLLMDRTILENIILPMQVAGVALPEGKKRAEELLQMVGLIEHTDKFPVQLSGGELQRVAIARALALSPEILLADEPTGNLDPQTAREIVNLLEKINEMGTTIIMATHNLEIVNKMQKRVVSLEKGNLVKDEKGKGHNAKKDKETTKEEKESKISKETKDSDEVKETKEGAEISSGEKEAQGLEESDASDASQDEKIEHHKKETKKLSDLLARARKTLQRHKKEDTEEEMSSDIKTTENKHGVSDETNLSKDAQDTGKDMPFGFSKDEDIAKKEKIGEEKEKDSSKIEEDK